MKSQYRWALASLILVASTYPTRISAQAPPWPAGQPAGAAPAGYAPMPMPGPGGPHPAMAGVPAGGVQPAYYQPHAGMAGHVQPAAFSGCADPGCSDPGCADGRCGLGGGLGLSQRLGLDRLFGNRGGSSCGGGCGGACGGPVSHLLGGAPAWGGWNAGGGGYDSQVLGHPHGPYGEGGCCTPRWFDVQADWLFFTREDQSESIAFTSRGILGPTALSTDDLDLDDTQSGFRVTGAYLVGPSTSFEVSYFGRFNWARAAEVTGEGDLYSVFSDFGSNPINGFPETDAANLHRIAFSSELDNGELNLRRRWVSANCVVHSSWLVGVRYLRVAEDFAYNTQTDTGSMDYQLRTDNDLVGVQVGTEWMVCVTPRFTIGGDIDAGVYGTHSKQKTIVEATSTDPLLEFESESDAAFASQGGVTALFRATPRLTLRAGYQLLYIDGVALALDNFNTTSPFSARESFLNNDGDVFYHGANLGFDWTW